MEHALVVCTEGPPGLRESRPEASILFHRKVTRGTSSTSAWDGTAQCHLECRPEKKFPEKLDDAQGTSEDCWRGRDGRMSMIWRPSSGEFLEFHEAIGARRQCFESGSGSR